jgi:cytoskeleton protein RodZ
MSEPQSESQQNNNSAADSASDSTRNGNSDVGALLRASRLRIGEELREVVDVLRIRYRYLEDIEAGRYDALPGTTYAMGFIRTYADYLGLDTEEVVRRFKEEIAVSKGEKNLEFPVPIGEASIPAGAVIFVGLVIAVLTYGVWYASTTEKGFIAELISPLPETSSVTSPEVSSETSPATDQSLEAVVSGLPDATTKVTESQTTPAMQAAPEGMNKPSLPDATSDVTPKTIKPTVSVSATTAAQQAPVKVPEKVVKEKEIKKEIKKVEPVKVVKKEVKTALLKKELKKKKPEPEIAATPTATPVTAPVAVPKVASKTPEAPTTIVPKPETNVSSSGGSTAGRVYGTENSNVRIIVRAKKNSWIQVRDDVANKLLLTRLLRSGDSYRVPNRAGLKLLAGNAGALEILVDGKSVPSIGPQGAVRRSVALDAARLLEGKAVIE